MRAARLGSFADDLARAEHLAGHPEACAALRSAANAMVAKGSGPVAIQNSSSPQPNSGSD